MNKDFYPMALLPLPPEKEVDKLKPLIELVRKELISHKSTKLKLAFKELKEILGDVGYPGYERD